MTLSKLLSADSKELSQYTDKEYLEYFEKMGFLKVTRVTEVQKERAKQKSSNVYQIKDDKLKKVADLYEKMFGQKLTED